MMLTRNLLAAIQTFRIQQALLRILFLAGPATTQELASYCTYRIPSVTHSKLQRLLTQLRKARALRVYRQAGDRSIGVLWAIPGQAKPHRPPVERRQRVIPVPAERREVSTQSWWTTQSREGFTAALRQRWAHE